VGIASPATVPGTPSRVLADVTIRDRALSEADRYKSSRHRADQLLLLNQHSRIIGHIAPVIRFTCPRPSNITSYRNIHAPSRAQTTIASAINFRPSENHSGIPDCSRAVRTFPLPQNSRPSQLPTLGIFGTQAHAQGCCVYSATHFAPRFVLWPRLRARVLLRSECWPAGR
jgi:hypothetical protein